MLPPHRPGALTGAPVLIGRGRQLEMQDACDLLETERHFSLTFRKAAQVVFQRNIFASHHDSFLYGFLSLYLFPWYSSEYRHNARSKVRIETLFSIASARQNWVYSHQKSKS